MRRSVLWCGSSAVTFRMTSECHSGSGKDVDAPNSARRARCSRPDDLASNAPRRPRIGAASQVRIWSTRIVEGRVRPPVPPATSGYRSGFAWPRAPVDSSAVQQSGPETESAAVGSQRRLLAAGPLVLAQMGHDPGAPQPTHHPRRSAEWSPPFGNHEAAVGTK